MSQDDQPGGKEGRLPHLPFPPLGHLSHGCSVRDNEPAPCHTCHDGVGRARHPKSRHCYQKPNHIRERASKAFPHPFQARFCLPKCFHTNSMYSRKRKKKSRYAVIRTPQLMASMPFHLYMDSNPLKLSARLNACFNKLPWLWCLVTETEKQLRLIPEPMAKGENKLSNTVLCHATHVHPAPTSYIQQ